MYELERFKFENFKSRHREYINITLNDHDFKKIVDIGFRDRDYIKFVVIILEDLCVQVFTDYHQYKMFCEDVFAMDIQLYNQDKEYDYNLVDDLIHTTFKISQRDKWEILKGSLIEFIVNKIILSNKLKLFIEPEVRYKKNKIVFRNKNYKNKNFDILAHINLRYFILGEIKTNMSTYVYTKRNGTYALRERAFHQVQKINKICEILSNSRNKHNEKAKIKKYFIVLNKLNIPIASLSDYKVETVRDILDHNFFLSEMVS